MQRSDVRALEWCRKGFLLAGAVSAWFGCASSALASSSVEDFIAKPSLSAWEKVQVKAGAGQVEPYVAAVVRYQSALERRDLPNSMASEGDPDLRVKAAQQDCDVALLKIKSSTRPGLWPLLTAMAKQDDDMLSLTGLEILARLSPQRFKVVSEDVLIRKSNRRPIVDRVIDRWKPTGRK